jgi:DNA-binding transcriptional ArsR family regulator
MSTAVADPEPAVFAALADPTRWRLLGTLAQQGEGTATTLAAQLPVSRPAVIKHLVVLDRAGLVSRQRAGREVRYRVEPAQLHATAQRIADLASAWNTRLAALKALAEEASGDQHQTKGTKP